MTEEDKKSEVQPVNNSLSNNIERLGVQFNFQAPQLNNYEEVYTKLKAISDRYDKVVIPDAEQAKEISKRGGLLTQMRKAEKQATNMRTQVHREAKNAYADFDDKMNSLIDLIHSNITNLNTQANKFIQQQDENRFKEIKQMFNEERNSYQFKDISKMFISFDEFYDKKYLHNYKDNKIKELIVAYLSKKAKDDAKALKFFKKNPDIVKMSNLVNSFKVTYTNTGNIDETIANVLEQKIALDKIIEERSKRLAQEKIDAAKKADEAEKLAQTKTQAEQVNANSTTQNTAQRQLPKGILSFEITDLSKANLVKHFLEKNNIQFNVHFKPTD